ncbi:hypothetical protein AAHC03_013729 [Spirometra sp. Aus1]
MDLVRSMLYTRAHWRLSWPVWRWIRKGVSEAPVEDPGFTNTSSGRLPPGLRLSTTTPRSLVTYRFALIGLITHQHLLRASDGHGVRIAQDRWSLVCPAAALSCLLEDPRESKCARGLMSHITKVIYHLNSR